MLGREDQRRARAQLLEHAEPGPPAPIDGCSVREDAEPAAAQPAPQIRELSAEELIDPTQHFVVILSR
jgi:hypothetical protein